MMYNCTHHHFLLFFFFFRHEAEVDIAMLSPGMGSLCNSHLGLDNLESNWATYDTSGLETTDPGMGAFSGYHNRESFTTRDIRAGAELFISYGDAWFRSREKKFGPVPHQKNYIFAERFLIRWHKIANKLTASSVNSSGDEVKKDLWQMIRSWPWKSRSLAALPTSLEGVSVANEIGLKGAELEGSVRSPEWLREHGKCIEHIEIKQSTIPQAGRGAFIKRFIQKGDVIAPAPLIHLPYKDTLYMYTPDSGKTPSSDNNRTTDIIGEQLLLNYCYGHKQSSILLCPYSNGVPYINHNHQTPNARIVWPERPLVQNSTWLDQTVEYIDEHLNAVAFEFDIVATRDIQPSEEVLIDYGHKWEEAWNERVSTWTPETDLVDSSRFNCIDEESCLITPPIRTQEEQSDNPYPETLSLYCYFNLTDEREDETSFDWDSELVSWCGVLFKWFACLYLSDMKNICICFYLKDDWKQVGLMNKYNCTILERQLNDGNKYTYTVELSLLFEDDDEEEDDEDDSALVILNNVPQWGIVFVNNPYTSHMHRRGAFRHHMAIPDDIFPESWKNLL